jgi:hypothetical protein
MNGFFKLFQGSANTKSGRRPESTRLKIEALEDRLALSASSVAMHAVQDSSGAAAVFFHGFSDNALYEKTPGGAVVQLAGANTVTDFSAGLDINGHPDVFMHLYGSMYEHDDSGWHWLNEPIPMLQFAAVKGGRCYAEANDNSLWEYTLPHTVTQYITWQGHVIPMTVTVGGWQKLWAANAVWNVDAVTQNSGSDMVFAVGGDRRLENFNPQTGAWQVLSDGSTWRTFSAGLDVNGNADVWMMTDDGSLERWTSGSKTAGGGWRTFISIDPPDVVGLTATSNGQVFMFQYYGTSSGPVYSIVKFDDQNAAGTIISHSNDAGMVAAGADDIFILTTDGHLEEHIGTNTAWVHWT